MNVIDLFPLEWVVWGKVCVHLETLLIPDFDFTATRTFSLRSLIRWILVGTLTRFFTARFRLEMLEFDFVCENILDSGTVALQKLDSVKNGNRFCYLAHTFDETSRKMHG